MAQQLIVSTSPHVRDETTTTMIMWAVVIALLPATGLGIYYFGWRVLLLILASVVTAVVTEYVIQKWRKVEVTAMDGSAAVTGLLLALVVSPRVPFIYIIIGAFVSIALGKQVYGGLGRNIWNPALVGRAFMQVSFPVAMNSVWTAAGQPDVISGATPLAAVKEALKTGVASHADLYANAPSWLDLFNGKVAGCCGETSALALVLGGMFLMYLKIVDWRIPFFYIGTAVLTCWALPVRIGGELTWFASSPVFHLLAGGLLIGGFFMATDMVTTPLTAKGKIIFAIGGGLLVGLIRIFGGYPEGVCYSILIMNTAVPLIDRFTMPKPFGSQKKEKK